MEYKATKRRHNKDKVSQTIPGPVVDELASDERLVELTQEGSKAAFSELVRRYQDRIYNLVRRHIGNEEDALDLTQDAFIKAYSGLRKFKQASGFYTWIYRIACNVCVDHRRRRRLEVVGVEDLRGDQEKTDIDSWDTLGVSADEEPERDTLREEVRVRVRGAVRELPERLKTVLILREFENLSYGEIARVVGCRVGTVKSRLFQARQALKHLLVQYITIEE